MLSIRRQEMLIQSTLKYLVDWATGILANIPYCKSLAIRNVTPDHPPPPPKICTLKIGLEIKREYLNAWMMLPHHCLTYQRRREPLCLSWCRVCRYPLLPLLIALHQWSHRSKINRIEGELRLKLLSDCQYIIMYNRQPIISTTKLIHFS